jgi:multidrug resistance efflux pump
LPRPKEAGGAEIASRLEAAEETIRQLAAETRRLNAQLQEQSNSSRRELHDIWQHLFKAENRDSQIERQVLLVTNRLGGVVSKVETLERVR